MDILINERSFVGQARYYNVREFIGAISEAVEALRPICPGGQILIHSSLMYQQLTDTQTLRSWLSNDDYQREDDLPGDIDLQAFIGFILDSFSRGPYIDELIAEIDHLCEYRGVNVDGSAIAGAICLEGMVVSLGGCREYEDGPLEVYFCKNNDSSDIEQRIIPHFVDPLSARKCRRRYVPNGKHHPKKTHHGASAMLLDLAYDPMDESKELRLRDPEQSLLDTEAQRLLDRAKPGGKQLYARTFNGKMEIFYEFQDDNVGGFHGYPVPVTEVPSDIVRKLRDVED